MPSLRDSSEPRSLEDLQRLPKAELHLHLRGAIPLPFLRERFRKYPPARAIEGARPRTLAWMLRHPGIRRIVESPDPAAEAGVLFQYASLEDFLAAYVFTGHFVRHIVDFRDLIDAVRSGLRRQRVLYAEVTVSLPEYLQQGIALEDLLAALGEPRPEPPRLRWIVDPVRTLGPDAAEKLLVRVLKSRPRSVVGLTLGGAEHLSPPGPFRRAYQIAREGGLRTTVHAGEALGPQSVWDALRILEVERIGHGVRAIEDPALVRCLAERGIPLEVCPTSNVRTGVYPSLERHPARSLYEAGVPLAISTDDPTFFGVSLAEELACLASLGFGWAEIAGIVANGFRFAFDRSAVGLHSNRDSDCMAPRPESRASGVAAP